MKSASFESALAAIIFTGSVMAADSQRVYFHAVYSNQMTPKAVENKRQPVTESKVTCNFSTVKSGGVELCAKLNSGASGSTTHFIVTNDLPVITGAQFLQVIN